MPDFRHTQSIFAAHLRNPYTRPPPVDVAPERLALYRELLLNNLESFLRSGFPVLRQVLDEMAWKSLVEDFFARHSSQTPYFFGIAEEFLRYLHEARGLSPEDPPFLLELAHYEWVELALELAEDEAPPENPRLIEAPLEAVISLSPLAWPLAYRFPVQRIGVDYRPREAPPDPTCLTVYRDRHCKVRFLEVTPLTHGLLCLLRERGPLPAREAFAGLCKTYGVNDLQALLAHGAALLRELAERGIIG